MGRDGLKEASEIAVLNSNYMKEKILKSGKYMMPYKRLRKHEFVLSCEKLKQEKGISAKDVAKRLLDYGLHPPTIYFPLIVKEAGDNYSPAVIANYCYDLAKEFNQFYL